MDFNSWVIGFFPFFNNKMDIQQTSDVLYKHRMKEKKTMRDDM